MLFRSTIGACAFENCTSLKSVVITENIYRIGDGAFNGCKNIESVTVEKGNTWFVAENGFLYDASKSDILLITKAVKGNIVIPIGMRAISAGMFADNENITGVEISDTITDLRWRVRRLHRAYRDHGVGRQYGVYKPKRHFVQSE